MATHCALIDMQRPSMIEFGCGAVAAAARLATARGFRRPLVVADRFNAARVDRLGLPGAVAVFGDVNPEPDIPNLEAALAMAQAIGPDLVVGFGGGSAMDIAKFVAVLPGSGQTIHDVVGAKKTKARAVALIQIPTTSGTGSEV